ncbi:MAG: WG repeat-containing protein, partial [Dehalococcoidales bacterium]|nr:WG repeat-containing protein [Dehalococcoidales bacterium]
NSKPDWGYIDINGNVIIPAAYYEAGSFVDGIAVVCLKENASPEYAYIDINGNLLFNQTFRNAGQFSNGLAPVVFK